MRIEQLKYFVEIAKTGSIRKAADNLFISSPALSVALQNLEQEIGFPLFNRHHSGVTLTSYGQTAFELSKQILSLTSKFDQLAIQYNQTFSTEISGSLKVSLTFAANNYYLHEIVPFFLEKNPKIKLSVIEKSSNLVIDDVLTGISDIGISFCNSKQLDNIQDYSDYCYDFLYYESMYILVNESSIFAQRKSVSLEEIITFPLALTASDQSDDLTYKSLFSDFDNVNIVLYSNNINLIRQLIVRQNAIGLTFSNMIDYTNDNVKAIPICNLQSFPTYAIYNKTSNSISIIERFIQIIKEFSRLN